MFLKWTFFAMLWYLIAWAHNDLEFDELSGERLNDGKAPCLTGGDTIHGVFMLSMESQVSTGYGEHYPNEECHEAIFLLIAQLVCGVLLDGCLVGIFYQKMIRPTKYTKAVRFSKNAVICQRDGKICLIFRIVDHRQHHGIKTKVKAFIFREKTTMEGEHLGQCQSRLKLVSNGKLFLVWPETVCHYIDVNSPLYHFSAKSLLESNFEICVSITGDSRKTGQTVQARTSYLSSEILWGHRFTNIIEYDRTFGEYVADYERFDETISVDMPLCSAKRLDEMIKAYNYETELQALRDSEIKENNDNDEEEDIEVDLPDYSEDTDLDIVEDLKDARFLMNRKITRTTSVTQNFRGDDDQYTDKYQYITKSLTDIERERIVASKSNRLRKYRPSLQTMELDYDYE
uniref:CSON008155 protein n=1 Tax=Culicoides sonorensis TaxID=179676 RepID=A0A336MVW0_CULSO